jgi:hypothetical protein
MVNGELDHGRDEMNLLSCDILGGTEKTHQTHEASWCPIEGFNQQLLEYGPTTRAVITTY